MAGQQLIGLLQQGHHHIGSGGGIGRGCGGAAGWCQRRAPHQRDPGAIAHHREHHHPVAVPEHQGLEPQGQGRLRCGTQLLLLLLQHPEHQGPIELLHIDACVAEPALAAPLPAGHLAAAEHQHRLPVVEAHGFRHQQTGHHLGQQFEVALIGKSTVLVQQLGELNMKTGGKRHGIAG